MQTVDPKSATALDKAIGAMLRAARKEARLSQTALADLLGLTFQQVQKYETGANRVSASRLYDIADALNKPITYFFQADLMQGLALSEGENEQIQIDPKLVSRALVALTAFKSNERLKLTIETIEALAQMENTR